MARIALVVNAAWNVWNFRLSLLKAIEEAGHEVIVIAPTDEYAERLPFPFYPIDITSRSTNPLVDFKIFLGFIGVFLKSRPDIVLLYTAKPNVYGNFAARLLGIKSISNVAGLGVVFVQQGLITKTLKSLYRISLRVPEVVFFQNSEDKAHFLDEGIVSVAKADILPGSGVDLQRFSPASPSEDINNKKFVFLLSARMLWDKGVGEFVAAARTILKEYDDIEFRLIGFLDVDNPMAINKQEMQELTVQLGISYLGVSDNIEVEIAEADCFVLPTLYKEGTPKSLLEAAAMGKPLITTDAPGCRDVVEDGVNGYLWRPGDIDHLYELMKRMIKMGRDERSELGRRGREKMVKEFDDKIVIRKYLGAINRIASDRK